MLEIRLPVAADHPALADLFIEMQAHYQVPCPSRDDLTQTFARLPSGAEMLIACDAKECLGFAAFGTIFPGPGIRSGFFLKELFVTKPARGKGIGRALIEAVAALAVARGHQRVDWTADRNNQQLVDFYRGIGAVVQEEKVFFRLSGEALRNRAK
ncbi:GNAT family N-acetyltransferase [Dongia rigui]|uniref:GNAT family N-acetyltransferase n=1 Tax=Dongia rigui TaxID=940149 RepID=A0ABU5E4M8_9PROT|nr:GNAT family N-acetyltransferase [Dongia rigui]MDY0874129.1 GNAT family N-acetyltransferase [Dongia rigui]